MRYLLSVLIILLSIGLPAKQLIDEKPLTPTETLQNSKDRIQAYVNKHKNQEPKAFKVGIKHILTDVFDTLEISRRSLGRNWLEFSQAEKDEFVELFGDLLLNNYAEKFKQVEKTKIEFRKERITEGKAVVDTIVTIDDQSYNFSYRMLSVSSADGAHSEWRIYDVIIENVSLVSNYRSEFASIIEKEGAQGLLKKLRLKVAK